MYVIQHEFLNFINLTLICQFMEKIIILLNTENGFEIHVVSSILRYLHEMWISQKVKTFRESIVLILLTGLKCRSFPWTFD